MAFGTPVIVWNDGAMPEIVDEGVTGFVVDSVDEAVAAVARLDRLDRRARCGQSSKQRFSADRMVRDYVAVYARLIGACGRQRKSVASARDRPAAGDNPRDDMSA